MALAELIDQRTSAFERPERIGDIIGSRRETRVSSFYDIIDALSQRRKDEALVLEGFDIIPSDFYSPQNFSKRGKVIRLNTFYGNTRRLRENRWSELKARIEAHERYKREQGPFIGWAWMDPERNHHIVRPSVVVEGHRIHQYAHIAHHIFEKIKVYSAKDATSKTIGVQVPSRSSEEPHEVRLEHVPVNNDEKYVEWTRVSSRHDCAFKRNDFTLRWEGRAVRYCPHDVAAYVAYSRRVAELTAVVIPQIFPMFTEPFLRAFMGAAYHSVKIDDIREEGRLRHRSRPLSFPEIDAILMDAWLKHGNKQTCFVRSPNRQYETGPPIGQRKRMRDYDWSTGAPGLQFGGD